MALSADQVKALAHTLHKAEHERTPIGQLSEQYPNMTEAEAYAIQLALIGEKMAAHGSKVAGWKVGLTSKAMQQMLNVGQPDFGHLMDDMRLEPGQDLDVSSMIWPRVEAEVAFILKSDLRGPGVTADQALAATEFLAPALEIIDTRIRDWKIKLCDTIADNASCGRFLIGKERTAPAGFDVKLIGLNYHLDDQLVSTATSAAVLGNPAYVVAWLANVLAPYGQYLQAGQVVMPGSLVAALDAKPGHVIRADFDRIGSVELRLK